MFQFRHIRLTAIAFYFVWALSLCWGQEPTLNLLNYLQSTQQQQLLQKYQQAQTLVSQRPLSADALGKYRIIFVRGIFTNVYPRLAQYLISWNLPIPAQMGNPFHTQMQAFLQQGWDVHIVPFDTQQSSTHNGATVAQLVQESDRPVLLITHSKGGLDTLYGLMEHPEIMDKVAGWLSLQTPFLGTPLIDCLLHCPVMDRSSLWLMQLLGGDMEAYQDLDGAKTKAYLQEHQELLQKLIGKVPTLAVGSFLNMPERSLSWGNFSLNERSFLEPLNRYILSHGGGPNDGMVPPLHSCLPHAPCLILEQMDHVAPVMGAAPFKEINDQKRIDMLRALLQVVLR